MTEQKERLKKLYALALRGVGGEKEQAKDTERELAAFYALGKQLINARQNKRVIAPLFEELERLVNAYKF